MKATVEKTCTLNCYRPKEDGSVVRLVRCPTCTEGRDTEATEGEAVFRCPTCGLVPATSSGVGHAILCAATQMKQTDQGGGK